MSTYLVKASSDEVPASVGAALLCTLVERGRGAARFAWDEFFHAEHHNPHTQGAYQRAVRRFLAWCEREGLKLANIPPVKVGQYLTALGGSAARGNQHRSALREFFDRLVNQHVVFISPAAWMSGVKETVAEGKTPEITIEQGRTLLASIKTTYEVKSKGKKPGEAVNVLGLPDQAIIAALKFTACRARAIAKLRLQDFQHDGEQ